MGCCQCPVVGYCPCQLLILMLVILGAFCAARSREVNPSSTLAAASSSCNLFKLTNLDVRTPLEESKIHLYAGSFNFAKQVSADNNCSSEESVPSQCSLRQNTCGMLAVINGASDNVLHELLICSMCLHECFVGACGETHGLYSKRS